ncbi:hypothetical protein [Granulicella tundricola]|uniref:Uncharacterized protein n=1 Tax=Granulicella tundricola (strain ATCC BAA-1859 / DSM 23138 / MP5ACTX9) TaxID=1198114 RepID=E8X690_GRATM|nr:hypothetical protein [Granulicella tundricola]ADW70974.1 hypothetical protein AciX9_4195 [Granulicella tundricola MP5ACTX9]
MPRPISWLPRLHQIRKTVDSSVRSHYERKDIETLFELQPRAAQLLLEMLPTTLIGRSRLVARESLAAFLEQMRVSDDPSAKLEDIRKDPPPPPRSRLRTLIQRDRHPISLAELPPEINLTTGRLEIRFTTIEQLARHLYSLAQSMESDGDEMARRFEIKPLTPPNLADDDSRALFLELEAMEATHHSSRRPN